MDNVELIARMTKIANNLDDQGFYEEASEIDGMIKSASVILTWIIINKILKKTLGKSLWGFIWTGIKAAIGAGMKPGVGAVKTIIKTIFQAATKAGTFGARASAANIASQASAAEAQAAAAIARQMAVAEAGGLVGGAGAAGAGGGAAAITGAGVIGAGLLGGAIGIPVHMGIDYVANRYDRAAKERLQNMGDKGYNPNIKDKEKAKRVREIQNVSSGAVASRGLEKAKEMRGVALNDADRVPTLNSASDKYKEIANKHYMGGINNPKQLHNLLMNKVRQYDERITQLQSQKKAG